MENLRLAAIAAIQTQDDLLNAWRAFDEQSEDFVLSEEDIGLLRILVFRKIYPINAFALLSRSHLDSALEILLSRYLGQNVDPDRGFGGVVYDLGSMLTDIYSIGGEPAILRLITHAQFNTVMLSENRFIESLAIALDKDESEVIQWLASLQ